jgi:hypothetical protein
VFTAMGDDGLAVGAGLCLLRDRDGLATWLRQRRRLDTVYLVATRADPPRAAACRHPRRGRDRSIQTCKAGAIYAGRMIDAAAAPETPAAPAQGSGHARRCHAEAAASTGIIAPSVAQSRSRRSPAGRSPQICPGCVCSQRR